MLTRREAAWLAFGLTVVLILTLPAVTVCRDWAFMDRNTGSRHGYREWITGHRTGEWYQASVLETFMRAKHPGKFRQDWVSYAGTGRDVFGFANFFGHGYPGPILSILPNGIDAYCGQIADDEKLRIYEVFSGGDEAQIRALAEQINDAVIDAIR